MLFGPNWLNVTYPRFSTDLIVTFILRDLIPSLIYVARRTAPMPEKLLKNGLG
jgi:hypothetical protein